MSHMPVPFLRRFPGAQGLTCLSVLTLLFLFLLNVDQNVTILLLTWVLPGVQGLAYLFTLSRAETSALRHGAQVCLLTE